MLMAHKGMAQVPGLQRGSENYDPGADTGGYYERFMGPGAGDPRTAATTTGAWGDPLGPSSVAVSPSDIASGKYQPGQWIDTPRGWKQVQDTSWVRPGRPNPSGTMEYWLGKGGGKGGGRKGGGMPGWFRPGIAGGEAPEQHYGDTGFPHWMNPGGLEYRPGDYGGGPTQDPNQYPPRGNVIVGGGAGNFAPGVYTGELGGPGDPHGSNNPLDYLNPFGGTTKGGSGTGVPTQKAVGTAVGTLSNFLLPGSGFITGPLARWVTHLMQGGMSKPQAQQVAQQKVAQGKLPPMPSGSVSLSTGGGGGTGGGFDFGNMFGGLPEGFTESNQFGHGAPTFTGPGYTGPQWSGGSIFNANMPIDPSFQTPTAPSAMNPSGYVYPTHGGTPLAGAFSGLGGMGTTANIGALGGGAVARHMMSQFANQGGYLAPTQALVGGAPPGGLQGTQAGGYWGNVVNPAALGSGFSSQGSIHFLPKSVQ
jgi:hypothetical protein